MIETHLRIAKTVEAFRQEPCLQASVAIVREQIGWGSQVPNRANQPEDPSEQRLSNKMVVFVRQETVRHFRIPRHGMAKWSPFQLSVG